MDVNVSTACFYPELLTEGAVKVIADMGVKKLEVFLETMSEYEPDYCKNLLQIIEDKGLEVYSVHSFAVQHEPYLFDKYRPRKEDSWRLFRKVVQAAGILGAKCITFHGPGRKWLHNGNKQLKIKEIAGEMDRLAAEAEKYGVLLAWENVYWCLSYDPDIVRKIMEQTTSKNIGFTLDIKQAHRSGVGNEEYLEVMGERLMNVHINDYYPGNMCLLPGKGQLNYKKLFDNLDRINYTGPLTIEVYRDNFIHHNEISQARDFLLSLMK